MITTSEGLYSKYIKIKLNPTDDQKKYFDQCLDIARFVYNWALALENQQYEEYCAGNTDKQFLTEKDLRELYKSYSDENEWLKVFPVESTRYIFSRLDYAFIMFFKGINNHPRFKKKKGSGKRVCTYNLRTDRFYIKDNKIRVPGFKRGIMIDSDYHTNFTRYENEYHDVKLIRDILGNYYVSFYILKPNKIDYYEENNIDPLNRAIGIDVNLRENRRYVCSNGFIYKGKNCISIIKNIDNLMTKITRNRYRQIEREKTNPDIEISNRAKKVKHRLRKVYNRLHNIHENEVQEFTKQVIKMRPSCIVMETLGIRSEDGMSKNHYVEKGRHYVPLFRCREVMQYKSKIYGIPFKSANRSYPSSQLCSNCGNRHKIGVGINIYKCPVCGLIIDRDLNAALNLEKLAYC